MESEAEMEVGKSGCGAGQGFVKERSARFGFPLGIPGFRFPLGIPGSSLNGINIAGTKHSKETGQFEGGNADLMSREAQGDPCGERKGGNGNSGCPGWKRARELRSWG